MRFPLDGELDFYLKKNNFIDEKKWLGVATYFCFFENWIKSLEENIL